MAKKIMLYDTTLRDGTQGEQVNLSAEEKLKVAHRLDEMGIDYIEGGWPGSNPKDARFFEMAKSASFKNTKLTAFGSTRRFGSSPEDDPSIRAILEAETTSVAVFGKTWDLHATEILGVTLDQNLEMIEDTMRYLKKEGREIIYDAEHFFDGFKNNPDYTMKTINAAIAGGADMIVLCDTNGGTLTHEVKEIMEKVLPQVSLPVGIHVHDDCGLSVANSIMAVMCGAEMVQGTINGYGERCGNVDLLTVIGNLQLKMGYICIPPENMSSLTELSRYISEIANVPPVNHRPFVGKSAFAHKGGVHVSAVIKNSRAYEHIDPEKVGNRRRVLVSDLSGKSNIEYKTKEMDIKLGGGTSDSAKVVSVVKELEDKGYQFEAAEGSLELLIKKITGQFKEPFLLESLRVAIEKDGENDSTSHVTIKVSVGDEKEITAAEGEGPVNALDNALRKALNGFFPEINEMKLVDFRVRVIEGSDGTGAKVRVRIDSRDSSEIWSTVGVSENIIEASWQALADSVQYKLLKEEKKRA